MQKFISTSETLVQIWMWAIWNSCFLSMYNIIAMDHPNLKPDNSVLLKSYIDIFVNCNWVVTLWQWYSTHLHTNNTQNNTKQTILRTKKNFWKSAGRAPSWRVIPWHLPYNWGKYRKFVLAVTSRKATALNSCFTKEFSFSLLLLKFSISSPH